MGFQEALEQFLSQCKNVLEEIMKYSGIERVIFNDPATVVYWNDGVKTVVRCQEGDTYDERTGLLLCCAKRLFGNTGHYNDVLSSAMEEFGGDAK